MPHLTPNEIADLLDEIYRRIGFMEGEAASIERSMRTLSHQTGWQAKIAPSVHREMPSRIDTLLAFLKATKDIYMKESP